MRHSLLLLVFPLLMCSCSNKSEIKEIVYSYDMVREKHIEWNNLFSVNDNDYFVYIYSNSCGHCNEIKKDVIEACLNGKLDLYFVAYTNDIPIIDDSESVIGKNEIDDMGIIGTPTLFHINDFAITEQFIGAKSILYKLSIL